MKRSQARQTWLKAVWLMDRGHQWKVYIQTGRISLGPWNGPWTSSHGLFGPGIRTFCPHVWWILWPESVRYWPVRASISMLNRHIREPKGTAGLRSAINEKWCRLSIRDVAHQRWAKQTANMYPNATMILWAHQRRDWRQDPWHQADSHYETHFNIVA